MENPRGYVVFKDHLYYKNRKEHVDDLQKAKVFTSKGTAKKVARQIGGDFREIIWD